MYGIAEVGELDLTASREHVADEDEFYGTRLNYRSRDGKVASLIDKLVRSLAPDVIAKLNDLERFGMLPARLQFVRTLAEAYGVRILNDTTLPWIPVVEPPGNVILRSKQSVVERLRGESTIFCGVNVGAGAAYSIAARTVGAASAGSMLLFALSKDEIELDYSESAVDPKNWARG